MWFNSMIRAKPYRFLTGVAWLLSVRVMKCIILYVTDKTLNNSCYYNYYINLYFI